MKEIKPGSDEWEEMWNALGSHALNSGDKECLHHDQVWQYVGTVNGRHHFRHKNHPKVGGSVDIQIPVRDPKLPLQRIPNCS